MSEIPSLFYQIGGGGALALLIIKEVRHWTTAIYNRRNGHNNHDGNSGQGERIKGAEIEISNMKDGFKEQRKENKEEHISIKKENKEEHETMEDKNRLAHAAMASANKKSFGEIKALIKNGGGKST